MVDIHYRVNSGWRDMAVRSSRWLATPMMILWLLVSPVFPGEEASVKGGHALSQWLMYQADLGRTGFNPEETILRPRLRVRWTRPLGQSGYGPPLIRDGRVYVASSSEGILLAYNLADGQQQWRFSYGSPSTTGGSTAYLAFGANVVYVATRDSLLALSETGQVLWRQPVTLTGRITVAQGILVLDLNYRLLALAADTGAKLWEAPDERIEYGLVTGNLLLALAEGRPLTALNLQTGQVVWRVLVEESFRGGVAHDGSRVYARGFDDSHLYAFDLATGRQVWEFSAVRRWKYGSAPAVAYGLVYYLNGDEVIAVEAATGAVRWRAKVKYVGAWGPPPVIANGVVYVSADRIFCLDAKTGRLLQSLPVKGLVASTAGLAIGEGVLAFVDGKGVLTILESGKK